MFSLEVFPPNKNFPIETVYDAIEGLAAINPAYISVTYGAGGNRANRSTCEIASHIKEKHGIEAMAHLTCINSTRDDVDFMLDDFAANGIENILALRGDNKPDEEPKNDFPHASDLTAYIASKEISILQVRYPETHVDAAPEDIKNLKIKVDAGASPCFTAFLDNSCYYDFEKRARAAGIDAYRRRNYARYKQKQIERMVTPLAQAFLKFVKMMQNENDPEAEERRNSYAIDQIVDLISNDVQAYTFTL
ncbi:MAG: methylenetetrahydrofolate reductase [[Eubacterium] siraeum]